MKRTTYQTEAAECGLACLVMIAESLGFRIDLLSLRTQVGPYPRGMKLTDLISCSDQLRIDSRALRVEPAELAGLRLPAVLHWDMSHFVVVDRVYADGSLDIRDPAMGRRRVATREVSAKFTGIAIEFAGRADFEPVDRRSGTSIWRLWKGEEEVREPLSRILLVSALIEIVGLGSPIFMQVLTDRVIPTNDLTFAIAAALVALVMILAQASGAALRTHLLEALRANLSVRASGSLFSHMLGLRAEYFQSRQAADLQSRFRSLDEIHRGISGPIVTTLFDATVGLVVICAIAMYSTIVAAFIGVCSLAYVTVRFSMHSPTMAAHEGSIISATRRDSFLLETVRGIEALKAFGASAVRAAKFSNLTVEAASDQYRVAHLTNIYQFLSAAVLAASNIGTIVLCAWMVISQEMTLGMLFAVVLLRATFMSRMLAAFDAIMQLKTLDLHAQRVSEISREVRGIARELPGESTGPCDVEISGVSYLYPGSRAAVISECNFKIADGESIGIVGASGSGKTTLGKLIVGMLLPTAGYVSVCSEIVHGEDAIRRHRMAMVSQSDILFAGTIAQNICMYDPDPDTERMRTACENACILADIERMPLGFNTPIGEGGTAMSGGQKQRLCLARALYKMPRLLLLDEATSHLDIPTEIQVLERLASLSMTRIHIAHRPQSIAFCDRIFDIESGKELTTDQALVVAQA